MLLWSAQPFGADSERFMDESLDVLQGSFKLVHSALYTRIKQRIYVYLSIDTLQTSLSLLKYKKRLLFNAICTHLFTCKEHQSFQIKKSSKPHT